MLGCKQGSRGMRLDLAGKALPARKEGWTCPAEGLLEDAGSIFQSQFTPWRSSLYWAPSFQGPYPERTGHNWGLPETSSSCPLQVDSPPCRSWPYG